jgi:UPF0716 protein FxsA
MRVVLILLFTALPLLELAILIRVGEAIGVWSTLLLLAFGVIAGSAIIQIQGLSALRRTMEHLSRGEPPIGPMLDGALLCLAGGLLIIPGFLTDIAALILLIPPIRHALSRWALTQAAGASSPLDQGPGRPDSQRPRGQDQKFEEGIVIEGEYERIDEPPKGRDHSKRP